MKKISTFVAILLMFMGLMAQNPGDLDMNYGDYGISIPEFLYTNSISNLSIMSDDKLVSGGYYIASTGDYGLLSYKFNTDGSLAPFGASTWFDYQLGFDEERIMASYVLPDDKILFAGYTFSSGGGFINYFVMCLLSDGTLDPSFGVGGISNVAGVDIEPHAIGVHYGLSGDYNIYVCGYTVNTDREPTILKLNQDGQIVTAFGTNGQYMLDRAEAIYTDIYLYSFQGNGYIYASGYDLSEAAVFVSKHDINTGSLESSFNTDGVFTFSHPTGTNIETNSLVFQSSLSDNTVAIFGNYQHSDGDYDMYALRLNCADGNLDNSFGIGGWSSLRAPGSHEVIEDAILQNADDKYYFGGTTNPDTDYDFMLGRLSSNGYLDASFGTNGLVLTDISEDNDFIFGLEINEEQDRVYAGGQAYHFSNIYGTIACYYTGLGVGISTSGSHDPEISVYPNPTKDMIHINTGLDDNYKIDIYDLTSKIVLSAQANGEMLQIDVSTLHSGTYILKLTNSSNITHITRVIKY